MSISNSVLDTFHHVNIIILLVYSSLRLSSYVYASLLQNRISFSKIIIK